MSVPRVSRSQTSNSSVSLSGTDVGRAVCIVCNKSGRLSRCSRCKIAVYCTKDHQRLDWKRHKEFCSLQGSCENSTILGSSRGSLNQGITSTNNHQNSEPSKVNLSNVSVEVNTEALKLPNALERSLKKNISPHSYQRGNVIPTFPDFQGIEENSRVGPEDSIIANRVVETNNSAIRRVESNDVRFFPTGNYESVGDTFAYTNIGENWQTEAASNFTEIAEDLTENLLVKRDGWTSPITYEGSSEFTILGAKAESLNPALEKSRILTTTENLASAMPTQRHNGMKNFPEVRLGREDDLLPPFMHRNNLDEGIIEEICRNVIQDLDKYGVCVVNNFLGMERGTAVRNEVLYMYSAGLFRDGQLVSNKTGANDLKTIRGDQITWLDGKEKQCQNIGMLISQVDAVIMRANKMSRNGKMGNYTINGRTKAMVACYPGLGSHYVKHVDNPNRDGRCITAIYYLNIDWDIKKNGGLLRIFPEGWSDQVADIEPLFDRILFFWSDRRNPHEVQPAYKTRYAITLWYFDAEERNEACRRYQKERELHMQQKNT